MSDRPNAYADLKARKEEHYYDKEHLLKINEYFEDEIGTTEIWHTLLKYVSGEELTDLLLYVAQEHDL